MLWADMLLGILPEAIASCLPDRVPHQAHLKDLWGSAGKFLEAAGSYVRALALCPASADLWAGLGMALTASGEPELADMADARDLAQIQQFVSNRPLQS